MPIRHTALVPASALAFWLITSTASAHHGIANFDVNREVAITGTVTELRLVNPHSWLHLDVRNEDGRVTGWRCELRGASVLRRSGWTPDMFAPGTMVTITGAPDRFTPNTCYLGTAVFSDGRRIDRYGQLHADAPGPAVRAAAANRSARLPSGRPNLAGDWAAEQRMLTDPRGMSGAFLPMSVARQLEPGAVPEGTQPFPGTRGTAIADAENPVDAYWNRPPAFPLTDAGLRAIDEFDGASTDNPRLRCEPTNILFDWTFEADVNRVTQQDDRITLLYGSMGLERTIRLDRTEHPSDLEPSVAGHSIGRWEEDVLVVETVGFAPGVLSADARIPHSEQLRVVERFTLDPERGALLRSYVAEDPLYLQKPYTGTDTVYIADVPYQPTTCDDQSYRSDVTPPAPSRGTPWLPAAPAVALIALAAVWLRRRRRPASP
jgi:MYXO-CTERM domain-containing protein